MSLTGDQRFLVLNGSNFFVYDSVAQTKLVTKVNLLLLEKLEILQKMVGTSLVIMERDRSPITLYAHDSHELRTWGVAIALNYLAGLPLGTDPSDGVSETLRQKAMSSTKQSEKVIDEIMERVYSIIGQANAYDHNVEEQLLVLKQLLAELKGFDCMSGAAHNELPGLGSQLVKNGLGKAKENFGLMIIALEHMVQPNLENWQQLKPCNVIDLLGWIIDLEELLTDLGVNLEESSKFSRCLLTSHTRSPLPAPFFVFTHFCSRPEFDLALKDTCPHIIGNFRFFAANSHGAIEDIEGGTPVWIELRAQRILVYSRMPELGANVTPMSVYPVSQMRSFKRIPAPASLVATQRGDRADSVGLSALAGGRRLRLSTGKEVQDTQICSHASARKDGRQCWCCVEFVYIDDADAISGFVCMSNSEQKALEWVNAFQLTQRALQARYTGPVSNEIPYFKQLFDSNSGNGQQAVESAVHDKCQQALSRLQDSDLSTILEACDRMLQYMREEVKKIERWDLDNDECSILVARAFANIIMENVTNYLRNSAKSNDVADIEHDEAFALCTWSLSFQAQLELVGVFSTEIISYDVCMFSHSLILLNKYALSLSEKLAVLLKACAAQDFDRDFQFEKGIKRTEAGLQITTTPIDAFSFLNGIIYRAVATGHQLAVAFVAVACIPVLKTFVQDWKAAVQASFKENPCFEILVPVANGMRHCSNLLVTLESDPTIESLSTPESITLISEAASILGKPIVSIADVLSDVRPFFQDAWKSCVGLLVECICGSLREILDPERVPDKLWNNGCVACCVRAHAIGISIINHTHSIAPHARNVITDRGVA